MADLIHELISPANDSHHADTTSAASADPIALNYLNGLASLSLSALEASEPQSLTQSSHSLLLSLQGLSKRSNRAIITSATSHSKLNSVLSSLAASTDELRGAIPRLDDEAVTFSTTFNKSSDNDVLYARKRTLLLSRNVERLVDVLDLPTILTSAITSGASTTSSNYTSALDLNSHVRRLHSLYPSSSIVESVSGQASEAMHSMAVNLISSLRSPNLKLAAALRTMGWLRRVLPDLDPTGPAGNGGGLGALLLVCRFDTLLNMLAALQPLKELADQERTRLEQTQARKANGWSGGQQTERYLKRYIEVFREQSFAIISAFRSIFPSTSPTSRSSITNDSLQPTPSALSSFPLHLIEMLIETLQAYLPTITDQASRESLLTQVLYCAGSLGRLGGDFSLLLAGIDVGDDAQEEWIEVVKRHRMMAGRLESIVGNRDRGSPDTPSRE